MSSVIDAGPCVRTNQLDFDDEVVFAARQKLFDIARERSAGKDARPFCMVVSLTHPHDPFAIPQHYWDLYRDEDIDMPAHSRSARQTPTRIRSALRHVCEIDRTPPTDQQVRNARRAYYGAISYVDDQFGAILAGARPGHGARGRHHRSIVTSDHGEMLGERGLWYKMTFFEGGCRVPLIVHAPKRFDAASRAARPSRSRSAADARRTGARRADATAWPDPLDGRSLLPHLLGPRRRHDEVIGEYLAEGAIAPIVMIRRGRFKFIHSPADPDQLYDLAADPLERDNLAARIGAYASQVAAFREEIAQALGPRALHDEVRARASGAGIFILLPRRKARSRHGTGSRSSTRASATCAITSTSTRSKPWRAFPPSPVDPHAANDPIDPTNRKTDIMKKLFEQTVSGVALLCAAATFASCRRAASVHAGETWPARAGPTSTRPTRWPACC